MFSPNRNLERVTGRRPLTNPAATLDFQPKRNNPKPLWSIFRYTITEGCNLVKSAFDPGREQSNSSGAIRHSPKATQARGAHSGESVTSIGLPDG